MGGISINGALSYRDESNGTNSYLSQVKMSNIKNTKPTPNPTSQNRYPAGQAFLKDEALRAMRKRRRAHFTEPGTDACSIVSQTGINCLARCHPHEMFRGDSHLFQSVLVVRLCYLASRTERAGKSHCGFACY